jgi:hypothetical protein
MAYPYRSTTLNGREKWNKYQRCWLRGYRYVQRQQQEYSTMALRLFPDLKGIPIEQYPKKNKGGRPRLPD